MLFRFFKELIGKQWYAVVEVYSGEDRQAIQMPLKLVVCLLLRYADIPIL